MHERTEKVCLNCTTAVVGRYCHNCGQENLEPKENFGHLVHHFFEDVTHFDGKFFSTAKQLFTKPGFLAQEYMAGRRIAYLNPVRMYLFISAILLLIFIPMMEWGLEHTPPDYYLSFSSHHNKTGYFEKEEKPFTLTVSSVEQYDSLQRVLPPNQRDGAVEEYINRRLLAIMLTANDNPTEFSIAITHAIFHALPRLMFITMPLMALVLYLLNYKRRQEYYYVANGIFILHYTIFSFLLLCIAIPLAFIPAIGIYLAFLTVMLQPVYMFIAIHRFYKLSWLKSWRIFSGFTLFNSIVTAIVLGLYLGGYILATGTTHL